MTQRKTILSNPPPILHDPTDLHAIVCGSVKSRSPIVDPMTCRTNDLTPTAELRSAFRGTRVPKN